MNINYENDLNPAQYEAVCATEGPVLVIAGAGSGKTRTIVYRLARLAELGVPASSILLLTFTRRASEEMLSRAGRLLGISTHGASGGTFHGFAYSVLRRHGQALGFREGFTLMDRPDSESLIKQAREDLHLGKGDKSFPKRATILDFISKSRNKELELEPLVLSEAAHLAAHVGDILKIEDEYRGLKQRLGLMDYDDLLFGLERLLKEQPDLADFLRLTYRYLMVDEYQDTNRVQGRLVKLLSGPIGNVMAVGDDAQSIYAFRGADVRNIMQFRQEFPGAKLIKLEENYRSTQPILDLTNSLLAEARDRYDKNLFSKRVGPKPELIRSLSDRTQAQLVVDKVVELSRRFALHDIAVLFRAGYQSFPVEVLLNRRHIPFQKYGGMRFTEAAHIKDVLAYLRLVLNPVDLPAWQRAVTHVRGVGPKTCNRLLQAVIGADQPAVIALRKKFPDLGTLLDLLDDLRGGNPKPKAPPRPIDVLTRVLEHYTPLLTEFYPDDYPKRQAGLDQLSQIMAGYSSLESFLADVTLESPDESGRSKAKEDALVLSTVHSSKGLEWSAVLVIDLVEDRFPSRHAVADPDDMEEERRLLYVACTRAKDYLGLFVPSTVFNRFAEQSEPAMPSSFVTGLPTKTYEEWLENYSGGLAPRSSPLSSSPEKPVMPQSKSPIQTPASLGFCQHKIFGRGKVVELIPPNKVRVNFPGFGLKIIVSDYLIMEQGKGPKRA